MKRILFLILIFISFKRICAQVWIPQNSGTSQHLFDVCFVSPTQGWAVGNNGTIVNTSDGGVNWTAQTSGTTTALNSISFISPTQGWAVGGGCVLTTTNGGTNWVNQFSNAPNTLYCVQFISPLLGWTVGANGLVMRTINGGNSWAVQTTSLTMAQNTSVFFTSASDGFVGDNYGTIFRTTDGGVNWSVVVPGNAASSVYDIYFISPTHGWAPTFGPLVHRTTNGGVTWNSTAAPVSTPNLFSIYFTSTTVGWSVGNFGIIFTSNDGGISWSNVPSNSTNTLRSICFPTSNNGWTVGHNGTILTYTCINPNPPTNNTLAQNLNICSGHSTTLSAQGFGNLTWYNSSTGGSYLASGSNFTSPALTINTVYYVQDSICSLTSSRTAITVTVNSSPTISVNNGTICSGQSFTINPAGASTYTYSSGTNIVSPINTTSYSVIGTGTNGCVSSNTAISSVTVNPAPTITASSGSICAGGSFTINPAGANTYTISGGSTIITPTITTSYSVTGTDINGCVTTTPAISNVAVNSLPPVNTITSASIICAGQSATVTANGANTYTWSNSLNGNSIVVSPTINTTYTVTGTDLNGCNNSTSITQSVSLCTGINALIASEENSVKIYPNPATSFFNIEIQNYNLTTVEVYNCIGQLLISTSVNENLTGIDLSAFANGLYIIKVLTKNEIVSYSKLVKNN